MMMYLINFVLCSGLLLIVYRLFLQNERMCRFNRFYLLFSLVFSLAVPFITIATKTETIPVTYQQAIADVFETAPKQVQANEPINSVEPATQPIPANYRPMIFIGLYVMVSLVLMARFAINLYRIRREVVGNDKVEHQQTHLVLTDADITPHSFLNYVFINRNDYADGTVAPEIILHEQTHVRQLHSIDVLLVELFQAVCWFNPFIPFYRKAIQLNHEFLADEAVIENYEDTPAYQYLLLSKASQAHSLQLTSQFNYLTTKKRLIMMTKITSAKMAWGKKLMLVPVLAACVFAFAQRIEAQTPTKLLPAPPPPPPLQSPPKVVEKKKPKVDQIRFPPPVITLRDDYRVKYAASDAPQVVLDEYTALLQKYDIPTHFRLQDITADDKAKMEALFVQMSKKQQDGQYLGFAKALRPLPRNKVTEAQLQKWQDKDYFVRIDDSNKRIGAEALSKYKPEDFDRMRVSPAGEWAYKHNNGTRFFVDLMTKPYYAKRYKMAIENKEDMMLQLKPVERKQ